jgi:ATP-binding cassette subfamily B protein
MAFNAFTRFAPYLKPYKKPIALGTALMLVVQAISISIPLLLKWTINALEAGMQDSATTNVTRDVAFYAGIIALFALFQWVLSIGMRWYYGSMSRLVERDLRHRYMQHLLVLPLAFFQQERVGDLVARATNDVESVQRFLYFGLRMGMTAVLAFVLSLIFMCSIDWELAVLALLPIPLTVFITRWVGQKVRHGFRAVQEQFGAMSTHIQENLAGMRVVKAYALATDETARFAKINQAYVDNNRHLVKIRSLFFPFTFLINGISMVIILWLGGIRVIEGSLQLGDFVAFNAYLTRLAMPMMLLGWIVDEYQRANASMERIEEILGHQPHPGLTTGTNINDPSIQGEIEFRGTHFAYNGTPVLEDINIHIPAGGTLGIVGRVGSGKTTLARLIPNLIQAGKKQLLIDGIPIEEIPIKRLRDAIGYVPQESFLFSDTLHENIALGASREASEDAAQIARLTADLKDFPLGMETLVGERGVTLSGGQKQRSALARAIVRDPRILILDDALASVDTHTEEEILKGLRQVMASRTTILIAHRISTVKDADHIVVLDDGRVAEQGTHDQLISHNGIYADIYQRQNLSQELETL